MIYEDPFDLGSGGASLTRASQAGVLFSNPALMPYGDGFHRWVGIEPTLVAGKDSIDFAKSMSGGSGSGDAADLIDRLTKTPLYFGVHNSTAYINKHVGFSVFNRFDADLLAKKYGETGLPEVQFEGESYQGFAGSFASMLGSRALSFGLTGKYLYAAEPELDIEITDQESVSSLSSPTGLKSLVSHNTGVGVDAGLILFSQGMNLDWKLAGKLDDIGGTKLSGDGTLTSIPQTYSAGLASTLHNGTDALHMAIDYRDISGVRGEKMFKRIRVSTKLLIRRYVGLGVGMLDGWPSYAAELDLIIIRLTGAFYTRELGDSPGVRPRPIYSAGIAIGF
jgi:hypothetical protein